MISGWQLTEGRKGYFWIVQSLTRAPQRYVEGLIFSTYMTKKIGYLNLQNNTKLEVTASYTDGRLGVTDRNNKITMIHFILGEKFKPEYSNGKTDVKEQIILD